MTIKSDFDLRLCFQQLRFDPNHHLGLGDIRLTLAQQEEIVALIEQKLNKHGVNAKRPKTKTENNNGGGYIGEALNSLESVRPRVPKRRGGKAVE